MPRQNQRDGDAAVRRNLYGESAVQISRRVSRETTFDHKTISWAAFAAVGLLLGGYALAAVSQPSQTSPNAQPTVTATAVVPHTPVSTGPPRASAQPETGKGAVPGELPLSDYSLGYLRAHPGVLRFAGMILRRSNWFDSFAVNGASPSLPLGRGGSSGLRNPDDPRAPSIVDCAHPVIDNQPPIRPQDSPVETLLHC